MTIKTSKKSGADAPEKEFRTNCPKRKNRTNCPKCRKPGRGICLFLFFMSLSLICGVKLGEHVLQIHQEEKTYHSLQREKRKSGLGGLKKRYDKLLFWVSIDGTPFDYPVCQDKTNPERYLHQDMTGKYSFYGTPFLDSRCSIKSGNLIVYGHNINGHRFFGYLQNYRQEAFLLAHPAITVSIGTQTRQYRIIAVLETDISDPVYSLVSITDQEDEIQSLVHRSKYAGQEIHTDQIRQLLTLSTCRSGEGRDKRLVIVAAYDKSTKGV